MTALNVQYIRMSASTTAAAKQVVAAVSGMRIRGLGLQLFPNGGANTVTIQSSTGGVHYGPYTSTGAAAVVVPPTALGLFETAASKGVYMQLNNATSVIVELQYQVIHST